MFRPSRFLQFNRLARSKLLAMVAALVIVTPVIAAPPAGPSGQPATGPVIGDVVANLAAPVPNIRITGVNLGTVAPTVQIGNYPTPLPITSSSPTVVDATLPSDITPGSYWLTLTTPAGNGGGTDEFWVTLGAVGPQGPEGPAGPQGQIGATGAQGPQGLTGANGVSGWVRVSTTTPLPAGANIAAYAMCPAGTKPLGGGWFGPQLGTEVRIARMEPDDAGYNVIAQSIAGYDSNIRVTVICATVN